MSWNEPGRRNQTATESLRIVARFQAGDETAFHDLYTLWAPRIRRFLAGGLADPDGVEDATQKVFINVFLALGRYQPRAGVPFESWLFRIARNRLADELRARAPVDTVDPHALAAIVDAEDAGRTAGEWLSNRELAADLDALPARQRQVLTLRFAFGLSNRHVAEILGLRVEYVATLQYRAGRTLRKRRASAEHQRAANRGDPAGFSSARSRPLPVLQHRRRRLRHGRARSGVVTL